MRGDVSPMRGSYGFVSCSCCVLRCKSNRSSAISKSQRPGEVLVGALTATSIQSPKPQHKTFWKSLGMSFRVAARIQSREEPRRDRRGFSFRSLQQPISAEGRHRAQQGWKQLPTGALICEGGFVCLVSCILITLCLWMVLSCRSRASKPTLPLFVTECLYVVYPQ